MSEYDAAAAVARETSDAICAATHELLDACHALNMRLPAARAAVDDATAYNAAVRGLGGRPLDVHSVVSAVVDKQIDAIIAECNEAVAELRRVQRGLAAYRARGNTHAGAILTGRCVRRSGADGTIVFRWSDAVGRYQAVGQPGTVFVVEYDSNGRPTRACFWIHPNRSGVPVIDGVITEFV